MAKKSQARKVKQSRRGKKKYSINWTKIPNLPGAKKKKGGDGSAAAAEAGPKGESSAASRQIGSVVRAMGRAKTKKELNELTKKAKSLVSKMKRPSSQSKAKGKIKGPSLPAKVPSNNLVAGRRPNKPPRTRLTWQGRSSRVAVPAT